MKDRLEGRDQLLAAGSLAASQSPRGRVGNREMLTTVRDVTKEPLPATRGERIVLGGKRFCGNGYQLLVLTKFARDLWNAWFGLGTYKNVPVAGGILQMKAAHKTTWRMGYTKGERKKFSLWKQAIERMLEELGEKTDTTTVTTFLDGMDELFQESKTILPFVTVLKKQRMERLEAGRA